MNFYAIYNKKPTLSTLAPLILNKCLSLTMKIHYLLIPDSGNPADYRSFTSLRHLCSEMNLSYPNADYRINRQNGGENVFRTETGKVLKIQHFEGRKRGKDISR